MLSVLNQPFDDFEYIVIDGGSTDESKSIIEEIIKTHPAGGKISFWCSEKDFGIYNVVAGFVSMFAFLNSSLIACIQRFYNYENGKNGSEGFRKVYNISLIVQFVLVAIVLILIESFGVWYLNNKLVIK